MYIRYDFIIWRGIKHISSCINVCLTPIAFLKTKGSVGGLSDFFFLGGGGGRVGVGGGGESGD